MRQFIQNFNFYDLRMFRDEEIVVEPSEILLKDSDSLKGNLSKANPWIRFLARFVDYSLFFFLLRAIPPDIASSLFNHFLPVEFFAWVLVESVLLASCGTTPGKWLLNISVRQGRSNRFSFKHAFQRSLLVWVRGIGMGISIVNTLCMLFAYHQLRLFHTTSWDRDAKMFVLCKPVAVWRLYLAVCVAFLGMVFYVLWKSKI